MKKDINVFELVKVSYSDSFKEDLPGFEFSIKFPSNFQTISGPQALANKITKELLTIPGSNAYDAQYGSPLARIFKAGTSNDAESVQQEFPIFLKLLEEKIKKEQALSEEPLQPRERLLNLTLVYLILSPLEGTYEAKIKIVTQSDEQLILNIGL